MTNYEERRQFKRIADAFIVAYRFVSPSQAAGVTGPGEHEAVASDVSEGGVGLDIKWEIPSGVQLELRFKMFNEHSPTERGRRREIVVHSETRHCRLVSKSNYRVGILFKNLSDHDREFISNYVRDQTLAQYGVYKQARPGKQ